MHWVSHWLGLDDASGPVYLWWSGFLGDVGLMATPIILLRRHQCHVYHCWRIGRHPVDGTPYSVCAAHHPSVDGKVTHDSIKRASRLD
jgi:hypothetical protein